MCPKWQKKKYIEATWLSWQIAISNFHATPFEMTNTNFDFYRSRSDFIFIRFLYVCSISFYSNRNKNPLVRVSIARVRNLFDRKCILWPNETRHNDDIPIDSYEKWMALYNNNESKHISGCIKSINTLTIKIH